MGRPADWITHPPHAPDLNERFERARFALLGALTPRRELVRSEGDLLEFAFAFHNRARSALKSVAALDTDQHPIGLRAEALRADSHACDRLSTVSALSQPR